MKTILYFICASFLFVCTCQAQDFQLNDSLTTSTSVAEVPLRLAPHEPPSFGSNTFAAAPDTFSGPAEPPSPSSQSYPRETNGPGNIFQLSVGYVFMRFRSAPLTMSLNGLHTSLTYYRKDWLGIEGSVIATFGNAPNGEAARLALYTVGPRVAWNTRRLQPWVHALAGGIRVFPQTASGVNGFAFQAGGGVDYFIKPLLSVRVESDYVRTQLYSAGQNSFTVGTGIVFHF
jgi:hypothetical protein